MSFHIRFFSLINKNRVVKSVTEKDANLIILRLTPLAVYIIIRLFEHIQYLDNQVLYDKKYLMIKDPGLR